MFEYLQPVFLKVHLKNDWNSCTLRSRKILLNSICLISFHVTYFLLTLLPHYLRIYTWEYDGNHNSQEGTGLDRPRPCFARICSRHACWLVPIRDITNIIYYILFVPFSHRCPHVHISWYHVFPSKNAVKAYISQSNMHNVCIVLVLGRAFSMLSCTIDWPGLSQLGMGMGPGPYPDPVGPDPNFRVWVQHFQTLRVWVRVWVQVIFLGLGSGS